MKTVQQYVAFEVASARLAWQRTCDAWSFTVGHIPIYFSGVASGILVLWLRQSDAAAVTELTQLPWTVLGMVLPFLGTLAWQIIAAPYRLYRAERLHCNRLTAELSTVKAPALECRVAIENAIESISGVLNPPKIPAKYIKVGVRSKGAEIQDCRASIVGIRRYFNEQESQPQILDPIFLRWSTQGEQAITLRPGVERFFDIMSCDERGGKLKLGHDVMRPLSFEGFLDAVGTYVIDLAIESSSPTKFLKVELVWNGNWNEVSARELAGRVDT